MANRATSTPVPAATPGPLPAAASEITPSIVRPPTYEVTLELLKEAGLCIRTSWNLINNLVRSFLYLNLILFTIFGVSLREFDVGTSLPSSGASEQHQTASTDAKQQVVQPSGKDSENTGAQRAEIIKILSFLVCALGIVGPVFAGLLLRSMINYGQNFLTAANKLEASIFEAAGLDQRQIGFYGVMSERYQESLKKMVFSKENSAYHFRFVHRRLGRIAVASV